MEEEKKGKCHLCRKICWFALKVTGIVLLIKWIKGKMGAKCECCGNEPCTCGDNCQCHDTCACNEEKKDEVM